MSLYNVLATYFCLYVANLGEVYFLLIVQLLD
jgi:hypothetical protein